MPPRKVTPQQATSQPGSQIGLQSATGGVPVAPIQPRDSGVQARLGTLPAANPPAATNASVRKLRILFVCIGNSCRSQMAEAFAKKYGSDVAIVRSAGVSPAMTISPLTRQVLEERKISIDDHFPKGLDVAALEKFDYVVNMSGVPVRLPGVRMIEWMVADPIGEPLVEFQRVADQIESLVVKLIFDLRNNLRQKEPESVVGNGVVGKSSNGDSNNAEGSTRDVREIKSRP
jgi:arsenate reductase